MSLQRVHYNLKNIYIYIRLDENIWVRESPLVSWLNAKVYMLYSPKTLGTTRPHARRALKKIVPKKRACKIHEKEISHTFTLTP